MRLIAKRLLPEETKAIYVQGEIINKTPKLKKPTDGKRFHVYCSPLNEGAAEAMREVDKAFGFTVVQSSELAELDRCAKIVVYLTALTWRSGEKSAQFADEARPPPPTEPRTLRAPAP